MPQSGGASLVGLPFTSAGLSIRRALGGGTQGVMTAYSTQRAPRCSSPGKGAYSLMDALEDPNRDLDATIE